MPDPVGLGLHSLKLSPPDPGWVQVYERERARLVSIATITAIAHIGSTAVPGIIAKPVIDVAALVSGAADDPTLRSALEKVGYTAHGEYGLSGRQFFTLGDPPVVHLHVVATGSPHWRDWIDFRDYLRAHPAHAHRYEQEKIRLSNVYRDNRPAYTRSKAAFVSDILRRARDQRAG